MWMLFINILKYQNIFKKVCIEHNVDREVLASELYEYVLIIFQIYWLIIM